MLCVKVGDGAMVFCGASSTMQAIVCKLRARLKQWRHSNKSKDLFDDLCQKGVKQRVFLHVNEVC